MYTFPTGLYTDVRIEDVFETYIQVTLGEVEERKEKSFRAAFIRVFDGKIWFYAATSDVDRVQHEIDDLARMASPQADIERRETVKGLEANQGTYLVFSGDDDVSEIPQQAKFDLLSGYFPLIDGKECVAMWRGQYVDQRVVKTFTSSKGADLTWDYQRAGFRITFSLADGEKKLIEGFDRGANVFHDLQGLDAQVTERYEEALNFLRNAVDVVPGTYTTVLSPLAAGIFAHESFGHKSESDFMLGDRTMEEEWQLGKVVGSDILSIIDDGTRMGVGYTPFDDEGTRARKTYLIKGGMLEGRLHNSATAASLGEGLTGNARSLNFEFEPIVRMTTTYVDKGDLEFDDLLAPIQEGVLVKTIRHGSGLSTFTLAPTLAYMIRDGKVAEPVKVSVVSGNVFETLGQIDGLSNEVEFLSFTIGGCGKGGQAPLPVGFGGPWVRVKGLHVQ
jgi:TldD protein